MAKVKLDKKQFSKKNKSPKNNSSAKSTEQKIRIDGGLYQKLYEKRKGS